MKNKKIKLVILDFDGTMGDSQKLIVDTLQASLKQLGLPTRTREECAATIGLPLTECFSSMIEMDDKMVQKCAEVYHEIFNRLNVKGAVTPFPYVIDTIKALYKKGYTCSIASSRDRLSLEKYVDDFGLNNEIEYMLGVKDTEKHKPAPEPVLKTLVHYGVSADEAVVIGDTEFDILMGNRAGTYTIGVDYGNGTRDELERAEANYVVSSFDEILNIIDK